MSPPVHKALTVAYSTSDSGALQMGMTIALWDDGFSLLPGAPLDAGQKIGGSISGPGGAGTIPFAGVVQASAPSEAHIHLKAVSA